MKDTQGLQDIVNVVVTLGDYKKKFKNLEM